MCIYAPEEGFKVVFYTPLGKVSAAGRIRAAGVSAWSPGTLLSKRIQQRTLASVVFESRDKKRPLHPDGSDQGTHCCRFHRALTSLAVVISSQGMGKRKKKRKERRGRTMNRVTEELWFPVGGEREKKKESFSCEASQERELRSPPGASR